MQRTILNFSEPCTDSGCFFVVLLCDFCCLLFLIQTQKPTEFISEVTVPSYTSRAPKQLWNDSPDSVVPVGQMDVLLGAGTDLFSKVAGHSLQICLYLLLIVELGWPTQ